MKNILNTEASLNAYKMSCYIKKQKLAWLNNILEKFDEYVSIDNGVFTCNLMELCNGADARAWYYSVLKMFSRKYKTKYSEEETIEMFHEGKNQKYYTPQNIENRLMWLTMLKTLVENGQF